MTTSGWLVMLAGPIRSGKSTLARHLADALDAEHVSFGTAVRERAEGLALPATRASWQRVGAEWVRDDPHGFCARVLAPAASRRDVVVDGVRHVHIVRLLASMAAGRRPLLVYVHVSGDVQRRRLAADRLTPGDIEKIFADVTESELPAVAALAAITVNGHDAPDANVARVLAVAQNSRG